MRHVVDSERLTLRYLCLEDTEWIIALLNDPDFLRFIGDRQVRSADDACRYLADGPLASYRRHGFGLYAVTLKEGGAAIGMCGLLQRGNLSDPDLGFAFLPAYRSQGFAREAADAVLGYARDRLSFTRVLAIVDPENVRSVRLLEGLGMRRAGTLPADDDNSLDCYLLELSRAGRADD